MTNTSHTYWESSHPYWENMFCRLTSQRRTVHEMCLGNTKNGNGEKSNLKNAVSWTDKLEAANWQTGGGAECALAFFWIDLHRFWHWKSLTWHPAEFKKVCKYGATMHIESARSLWRKNNPSGGLRSSNWLSSQLENLTRVTPPLLF